MAAEPSFTEADIDQRLKFRAARQAAFFEREPSGTVELVLTAGAFGLRVGASNGRRAHVDARSFCRAGLYAEYRLTGG